MTLKQNLLNEDGYTIIEILVALVLLSILIVFTTDVFTLVTSKEFADTKFAAIELAQKELELTINQKKYSNYDKELNRKFRAIQNIIIKDRLVYITINIFNLRSNQNIYELKAIRPYEVSKE